MGAVGFPAGPADQEMGPRLSVCSKAKPGAAGDHEMTTLPPENWMNIAGTSPVEGTITPGQNPPSSV